MWKNIGKENVNLRERNSEDHALGVASTPISSSNHAGAGELQLGGNHGRLGDLGQGSRGGTGQIGGLSGGSQNLVAVLTSGVNSWLSRGHTLVKGDFIRFFALIPGVL